MQHKARQKTNMSSTSFNDRRVAQNTGEMKKANALDSSNSFYFAGQGHSEIAKRKQNVLSPVEAT